MKLFILGISLFFLLGLCTGCFEQPSAVVLYVDDSYTPMISGWDFDHFDSIQSAVDSCVPNVTIYVNSGVYLESIYINKTLSLIGTDVNDTIIFGNGIDDEIVILGSNAKVTIKGFTIRDSGKTDYNNPSKAGIKVQSNDNSIVGNIFLNNSCGLYLENSVGNLIFNNVFSENDYGIYLYTGSNSNEIRNNEFVFNHVGARLKGSRFNNVSNNIFSDNDYGMYFCCLANDNRMFSNVFLRNAELNAEDWCFNTWNSSETGNFWDDFYLNSQGAFDSDSDGFIDAPYNISRGYNPKEYPNKDFLPLAMAPKIRNQFLS